MESNPNSDHWYHNIQKWSPNTYKRNLETKRKIPVKRQNIMINQNLSINITHISETKVEYTCK